MHKFDVDESVGFGFKDSFCLMLKYKTTYSNAIVIPTYIPESNRPENRDVNEDAFHYLLSDEEFSRLESREDHLAVLDPVIEVIENVMRKFPDGATEEEFLTVDGVTELFVNKIYPNVFGGFFNRDSNNYLSESKHPLMGSHWRREDFIKFIDYEVVYFDEFGVLRSVPDYEEITMGYDDHLKNAFEVWVSQDYEESDFSRFFNVDASREDVHDLLNECLRVIVDLKNVNRCVEAVCWNEDGSIDYKSCDEYHTEAVERVNETVPDSVKYFTYEHDDRSLGKVFVYYYDKNGEKFNVTIDGDYFYL